MFTRRRGERGAIFLVSEIQGVTFLKFQSLRCNFGFQAQTTAAASRLRCALESRVSTSKSGTDGNGLARIKI